MDYDRIIGVYCFLMEDIRRRTEMIQHLVANPLPQFFDGQAFFEFCLLNLRMVCEQIALGCLVAHGDIRTQKMYQTWEPDKIIKGLARLRPTFYPRPVAEWADVVALRLRPTQPPSPDYLTKEKLLKLYGFCGSNLHQGSMEKLLSQRTTTIEATTIIVDWHNRILALLNHHRMSLPGDIEFHVDMTSANGKPTGTMFLKPTAPTGKRS